ncbi:hypothetical protein R1sor_015332 [Riccia sorocarpa]|uniref:Protein kinase domain-containing protein n=1 Tax=Riccia sorocarpa TaxID=122646 RepID=A0ABD3HCA1_9MARC
MGASHIAGRLTTDEGKAWLVKKIEMWERWLNASKPRPVKLGSFSWKMKGCEPISDNQLRWITLKTQISDLTRKIGQGSYGSVYRVGFRDVALGLELGMEGVVPYVAKKCDEKPPYSAWVMMHKELASFAETHSAIVRPIACHNIEADPILVYPYWNGRDIPSVNGRKYPRVPKKERDWIALELVDSKIEKLAARNIHIRPVYEYNKATDVYALGVLTHQVCGDFFMDMTMPERNAYNKKYYALGAPKDTDPAGRNEILLKDLIQSATHHHAHMRTSAAQCFEVMSDTMKINPMTCTRPTETPSQQRRERTNVYEDYLNAERVNMAYGLAY